jgi:hypothetical protein
MNTRFRTSPTRRLLVGATILCAAALLAFRAGDAGIASSEADEIESVARDYIEGWYTGDVERMDRSLHDDLVKRVPVRDDSSQTIRLRPVSKARMVELTAAGGGENPDVVTEIFVDYVATDIATARVASPDYLDYLHLAKTEDGWKIVNILFHARD